MPKRKDANRRPKVTRQPRERHEFRMDDEVKIKLTMERFADDFPEVKELAARHGRSPAVVSRAIKSAIQSGLVKLQRVNRQKPVHSGKLERELKRRFRYLQNVMVVSHDAIQPDVVHERVGHAFADEYGDTIFWHGDRILIGPGRAVHHFADRLSRRSEKLSVVGSKIIVACADYYPGYELRKNVCLDASANALLLSRAFETVPPQGLTSRHLFNMSSKDDRDWYESFLQEYWADSPTQAVLGVGVLDERHRLVMLARGDANSALVSNRKEVTQKIRELLDCVEKHPESNRPLIAEVATHLFAVPGPSGADAGIREMLAEINDLTFAPTLEQLASLRSVAIMAGGEGKGRAVRHLLQHMPAPVATPEPATQPGLRIRYLCLDSACAATVLEKHAQ
jgi:Putative sugar-binding domain